MPKASIRLAESVISNLEAFKYWYEDQGVRGVGDRIVREIIGQIEARRDHPDIGRIVCEFEQPFLRELIYPPFRIVYRREGQDVRIVRVWRSERLHTLPNDDAT